MADDLTRLYELLGNLSTNLATTVRLLVKAHSQHDAELAEIRDGMIELDHKIARLAIREAHAELRDLRGHHDPAA